MRGNVARGKGNVGTDEVAYTVTKRFRFMAFSAFFVTLILICISLPTMNNWYASSIHGKNTLFRSRKPQTLWLLTCESRKGHVDLQAFTAGARAMEQLASKSGMIEVQVRNVCADMTMKDHVTKLSAMREFLLGISFGHAKRDLFIFSDSDALVNPYAVSAEEVMLRYDSLTGGSDDVLVVSAEPACYTGRDCSEEDMQQAFPNSTISVCPQFVNSGQYMGTAPTILKMLDATLRYYADPEYTFSAFNRGSDQGLLTWYYAQNRNEIVLDVQAYLFRSEVFGNVDLPKANGTDGKKVSCGPGASLSCGFRHDQIWHIENSLNKYYITFDRVPGCPASLAPFLIHFNGDSKNNKWFRDFQKILINSASIE